MTHGRTVDGDSTPDPGAYADDALPPDIAAHDLPGSGLAAADLWLGLDSHWLF